MKTVNKIFKKTKAADFRIIGGNGLFKLVRTDKDGEEDKVILVENPTTLEAFKIKCKEMLKEQPTAPAESAESAE